MPKQTKEELEAIEKKDQEDLAILEEKAAKEAEDIAKKAEDIAKSSGEEGEEEDEDVEEDEEKEEDVKEVKEEEEGEEEKEDSSKKKEVNYKDRFVGSQREAKVLTSKVAAFEEASKVPDPTDKDMEKEYSEWEDMSDFEKKIAKNDWKNTKRNEKIDEIINQSKNVDAWNKKVDDYIDDPQTLIDNPKLEGKLDDFKIFTGKPSRTSIDFGDLVSAFLYEVDSTKPAKKKGKQLETGTGGPNKKSKPSSNKISIADAAILKKTNYRAYVDALKADKIDPGV